MGCKKPTERAGSGAGNGKVAERGETGMRREHEHHHDAFVDPAKLATRWNDPERDRWQHPEEIVAALDLTPGATVADIGAGTGYMVAHLSKAVGENGKVIAVDVEPAMIEYLARRRGELGPAAI